MSIKQEEYSFYYKVKNESARKRLGFKAGFFWCTAKKQSLALSRGELAMDAAGFDEADFARPVRVHFPVENDIPPEGVFDTKFCENREPGGEDGKTLTLIPGAASAVKSDETELADGAGTPAGENGIQESHNPPANPQLTVVATLPFRHRVLAQYIGDGEYLYHVDTDQKKEIACLEMDTQNTTVQNLILAAENVEPFKKAIEHDIHKAVNAYKQVFPVDGKVPELCTTIKFFKEWFSAEHINRGLLVKEWAERLKNKPAPVKKTGPHKVIVDDVNKPERPRRSEKPTHRTINYELACGFCEELDLNNLRSAMDFAKRIIAEDREDWKRMSMTVGIIPDIKGYDRQTIIDLVRKAPKAVHNGNPDLRRTWCESFLAVHGVRDAESSVYWEDPETGILCRCRPDKIIPEFHWIMDVKTTADIQRFRTAYYDYRYHVQDAFYSDGYRAQFGEIPTFVFLVASTTAECGRYPVEIFMMGEDAKLAGQREYRRNLQTLAECLNNDEWPAIKTLSLPRWAKENANA
ncbi:PD-(D/E)XK nuclease-like domain-containing protein [Salmonella enterica]|nr:hypothetical protein [Salmonella enterica]EIU9580276.1 PD-(D/E)XK nuclease-like domain-containing protein [Salmonella enterica]ELC1719361.1 PD-(D/E)XK nuclease-like domain-containing protein [Salmonella enterica]